MQRKKKTRLSDIAEKLNVSTVTVSKALANKEGVGEDLRREIKALATEMGYHAKKSKSDAESENVTGNIGILIPAKFFSRDNSYYWYLFNFLSKELLSRNYYCIMELLSDEDEAQLKLPRMIMDNKVDGVIVLGQTSDKYLDAIHTRYDNFILLDFYTNNISYDSVSNDDYFCSYMITNYVISQGHKKIRFVGNFDATSSIRDRFMGFQKAMLENKLHVSFDEIIADRDEKGSNIVIPLPLDDMPTAFVCNCDGTAAMVTGQLEERGYRVPDDVSVTGFDNYLPHGMIGVDLTTVYIRPEDTAKTAAKLIINKIEHRSYTKGRRLVSGGVIIRDSVKDIR